MSIPSVVSTLLRVKLHPVHRQINVAHPLDDIVFAPSAGFQNGGDGGGGQ